MNHYILIDFENIQPADLSFANDESVRVVLFAGERQQKIPIELAMALQSFGDRAEYIRAAGTGTNALDFHIAFWIGRFAERDPTAQFEIVSNDKGFDPLIAHLNIQKIVARRTSSLGDVEARKPATPKTAAKKSPSNNGKTQVVFDWLKALKSARPRRRKTLKNNILNHFKRSIDDKEIDKIIAALVRRKAISFDEDRVTYHFGASSPTPEVNPIEPVPS